MIKPDNMHDVAQALEALEARGNLTPDAVVDAARDPASPLHVHFNWNIEEAANEHWRSQARHLIRAVRITVTSNDDEAVRVQAYVRNPDMMAREQGYTAVLRIRTEEDRAREVMVREMARVSDTLHRMLTLAKAFGLSAQVNRLLAETINLQTRLNTMQQEQPHA